MAHLLRGAPLSRAELALLTGLSAPTVGKLAAELIDRGIAVEAALPQEPRSGLGRPSRPLVLDGERPCFVAIHIGVRKTLVSALPMAGPASADWCVEFSTPKRAATWCKRLHAAKQRVGCDEPLGVVVSSPGVCDEGAGRVLLSPNLHWTEGIDLSELIRPVWDADVILVQEIRALALGHHIATSTVDDFLLADFGSGVGGALLRNGELYSGSVVLSGELGHAPIPGNRRPCGCGAIGCVETLTSRAGLLESFAASRPGRASTWQTLIAEIERNGLPTWLGDAIDAAAAVIAGAMNMTGVVDVVLTGAYTELPEPVMTRMRASITRSAMWARFGEVRINAAPRRRRAGLVAAAIDRLVVPTRTTARVSA